MTHERDEYFVRRLEAFSDIVIGFSLALLTLNLGIPVAASKLLEQPMWIVSYVVTFAIVCLMWWSHLRLFRTVFVPTLLNVIMNFGALMTVGLLVFFVQVWYKQTTDLEALAAGREYFSVLCINSAINAVLTLRCARMRRGSIAEPVFWRSIWIVFGYAGLAIVLASAVLVSPLMEAGPAMAIMSTASGTGWWIGMLAYRLLLGKHPISA